MYHLKKAQPNELKISNKCERKMKFDSLDGGAHGEHSGGGFVEVSKIFSIQDGFLFKLITKLQITNYKNLFILV